MKDIKNQKGIIQVLLVVGIVAIVILIGYMIYLRNIGKQALSVLPSTSGTPTQNLTVQPTPIPLQNSSDLNTASASLDSTDTSRIDTQLNQLNSATTGF
jgi:hypothetical protein